jgi:predicted Zn-dependent protease
VTKGTRLDGAEMKQVQASVQQSVVVMQAAKTDAEQFCAPWKTRDITFAEEHAWGHQRAAYLVAKHGPLQVEAGKPQSEKNARTAWLALVGGNLAHASARPELPWTFAIIENPAPMTLSAAGGFVFVTTGLLSTLKNEAQLAGLISHEIAHVAARHELARYRDVMHTNCVNARTVQAVAQREPALVGVMGSDALKFASRFGPSGTLVGSDDAGFSGWTLGMTNQLTDAFGNERDDELAADRAAAHLVAFAGYDVSEFEKALLLLPQAPKHPRTEDRVAKLVELRHGELSSFSLGTAKPALPK